MPPASPARQVRARAKGSNRELMDLVVARIKRVSPRNKEAGSIEVARTNKEILSRVRYVLSTGIRVFDKIIGGGFPFGRITELYGLESCGKTAMVMRAAVRAQQREIYEKIPDPDNEAKTVLTQIPEESDVTVLYIDNEQSLEEDEKIIIDGVEIDAVLARCDTVDLVFKTIDETIDEIVKFEKATSRKQFVVVVVDTIAGTSSKEEMTAAWGKDDYNRQPKQLRQAFRRITRKLNRFNVCMICTNQVSDSYAASAGKGKSNTPQDRDFTTFGGRALKYYASLRIFMYRMNMKWVLVKGAQFAAGILVGFYTSKNRHVKPLREGRITLMFDRGFDDIFSLLETLIFLDFAAMDDQISFKFNKWGIETTTFDNSAALSLNEDVESGPSRRRQNPYIDSKHQWPEFYAEHEADFIKMLNRAQEYVFATEGLSSFVAPETDEIDENEDEDDV